MLAGLEQASKDLQAAGCGRIYVDGSFVNDIPEPNDFDCCWDETGIEEELLPHELFDFNWPRTAQHDKYGGDIFPARWIADPYGTPFLKYFQRDKRTGKAKGIVAINL